MTSNSPDSVSENPKKHSLVALLTLFAGLTAIYLLYLPGMSASVMFDTQANLANLASATGEGAKTFIFGGHGGPLGRPLALATFALQAESWPHDPAALRTVNIVIHVVNGFLVAWLALLLARIQGLESRIAVWAGVLAGLLWASSPLLASTNLFIIQRMTSLSLLFVLAGILAHLHLRSLVGTKPVLGYVLISLSLGVFTVLAVAAKENGALLPAIILVLEFLLLKNPDHDNRRRFAAWKAVFLALPLGLILLFLLSQVNYGPSTMAIRDFNAWERFLTQCVILWEYLFHAFLPAMHRLGPFHDHYPVYRSIFELPVMLAMLGWAIVITGAVLLRRKLPLFAFAVAWYLVAHLLESTVLSLELYFEHRNYLPLVGPVIAASIMLFKLPQPPRRLLIFGAVLYLMLTSFVLARTATLWGNPMLAADFWHQHNPESSRATLYLTSQFMEYGDVYGAIEVLMLLDEIEGEAGFLLLQETLIRCHFDFENWYEDLVTEFEARLDRTRFSYSLVGYLGTMAEALNQVECENYSEDDLMEIAQLMINTDHIIASQYASYSLHAFKGSVYFSRGEFETAANHFFKSLQNRIHPQYLFLLTVSHLESGSYAAGCDHLEQLREYAPKRIYLRRLWLEHIDIYQMDIAEKAGVQSCEEVRSR